MNTDQSSLLAPALVGLGAAGAVLAGMWWLGRKSEPGFATTTSIYEPEPATLMPPTMIPPTLRSQEFFESPPTLRSPSFEDWAPATERMPSGPRFNALRRFFAADTGPITVDYVGPHGQKLSPETIKRFLQDHPGWHTETWNGANALVQTFSFYGPDGADEAGRFARRLDGLADRYNHHPSGDRRNATVQVVWSTHDQGGITALDTNMAERTDALRWG